MSRKALVEFNYNGNVYTVECFMEEKMKDICERLAQALGKDIKEIDFLYANHYLNRDLTFEETMNLPKPKKSAAYVKLVGNITKGINM